MLTVDQCREAYIKAVAADVFDGDVNAAKRLWLGDQSTFERQNRKGLIEANLSSLSEKKIVVSENDDSRLFQTLSYIVAGL